MLFMVVHKDIPPWLLRRYSCPLLRYCRHEMWQNAVFVTKPIIECQKPFIDTTSPTNIGTCSNRIYLGGQVFGAEWHKITVNLSMRCSGFFAQVRRGETFLLRTEDGKTPIDAFAVGAIKAFGSRCWKNSLSSRITNGS